MFSSRSVSLWCSVFQPLTLRVYCWTDCRCLPPRSFVDTGERVMNCQGIESVSQSLDQQCAQGIGGGGGGGSPEENPVSDERIKKIRNTVEKKMRADLLMIRLISEVSGWSLQGHFGSPSAHLMMPGWEWHRSHSIQLLAMYSHHQNTSSVEVV